MRQLLLVLVLLAFLSTLAFATTDTIGSGQSSDYFGVVRAVAANIVASSTGTLQTVGINVVNSGNIAVAIYADNAGSPGGLLGNSVVIASNTGWNDVPVSNSVSIVSGTTYWLSYEIQAGSSHSVYFKASGSSYTSGGTSVGTWANPADISGGTIAEIPNMRMTYLSGSSGLTTPTLILSLTSIVQGQSILFTANWLGGTGPYTINFLVYNVGTSAIVGNYLTSNSQTSNTFYWTPSFFSGLPSSLSANVFVTDTTPTTNNSISHAITFNGLANVISCSTPVSNVVPLNNSVYLNAGPNTLELYATNAIDYLAGNTGSILSAFNGPTYIPVNWFYSSTYSVSSFMQQCFTVGTGSGGSSLTFNAPLFQSGSTVFLKYDTNTLALNKAVPTNALTAYNSLIGDSISMDLLYILIALGFLGMFVGPFKSPIYKVLGKYGFLIFVLLALFQGFVEAGTINSALSGTVLEFVIAIIVFMLIVDVVFLITVVMPASKGKRWSEILFG